MISGVDRFSWCGEYPVQNSRARWHGCNFSQLFSNCCASYQSNLGLFKWTPLSGCAQKKKAEASVTQKSSQPAAARPPSLRAPAAATWSADSARLLLFACRTSNDWLIMARFWAVSAPTSASKRKTSASKYSLHIPFCDLQNHPADFS